MLIKSADDKKKRLRLLKELAESDRLDQTQKDWLQKEYRNLRRGIDGERDAAHYLDTSFSESKNRAVLHDLRLEADGQFAQIDHLAFDRTLTFFLLETKTFSGSLHINERGEFMVEYSGESRYGIPSPLEQSRRHETVLKKVLKRLDIVGRVGTTPRFVHVVLVHPKAIIHRPPANQFDTSMIIKADQFPTWHAKHIDEMGIVPVLADMVNLRGRDTLMEWADRLKSEHRPTNLLELPDFIKPRASFPATQRHPPDAAAEIPKRIGASENKSETRPKQSASDAVKVSVAPICATCGKRLTPKAAKFCKDKAAQFGGQFYCYDHQAAAKR